MASASIIERVLADIAKRITPSENERRKVLSLADTLVRRVKTAADKAKVEARVRIEGSVAKDTWLRDEPDIDIFMQLPTSTPRKALGTVCLNIAKEATKGSKQVERFAEHPYLEAFVDSIRVNIVPCYEAKPGEWLSATDRTPYHTDFVKPRLNNELRREIRLVKRFMKGVGAYGAEIKVGGFSGYLCELLTLHYSTFANVLKTAANWRKPWVVDYQSYYKGKEEDLPKIFMEPLIVVDPVDKGRNVASAVRLERLIEFVTASRQFLQHPTREFFLPKPMKPLGEKQLVARMKQSATALVFVGIGEVGAVPDILWGQLYKTQRSLRKMLEQNDFHVINDAVWSNEASLSVLLFEVEHRFLPLTRKHLGPPVEKRVECERFLQKHLGRSTTVSGPRLEDERWVVEIKRKHTDIVKLLETELRQGGRHVGVAELVSKAVAKKVNIFVNQEIVDTYRRNGDFAEFLTQHVDGKPGWLVEAGKNQ
ncbi:MAG TPA: CCA tRNA nucleotidyltransferase [Candidatus Bathyarchaeia archaeon]|nr:CCA tRNA nucleotidyltransferase [Candidatus Bathyarchaeia archaeon]